MSNYTKTTNFLAKDSLPENDSGKIIKGSEFDTEFNALQTSVNTKADLISPALSGTPTAPTASVGTNTTQLATTSFVQAALALLYPIGAIYSSTSSTNPGTIFGFGTWVAYGAGRVLIGASGAGVYIAGNTGGSANAVVVSHTHTATVTDPGHSHTPSPSTNFLRALGGSNGSNSGTNWRNDTLTIGSATTGITVANSTEGVSGTNANLPPYVVVYMWNRTA
ncbi:hypothetical protein UFOVP369_49 [uncultured Caudovirales phage]|uniref:Baseplate structural protein Gp10 C-terminal domain-containing protein n=1 Tax=uncultured Caudovirales phage TaxID=2100421 RepID=A0A6J7X1Q0_9CAUD|nr:hypothetical protein UFOVP369_49 [uncultured Caudovirales phage]